VYPVLVFVRWADRKRDIVDEVLLRELQVAERDRDMR
jgi:hypothetical protein